MSEYKYITRKYDNQYNRDLFTSLLYYISYPLDLPTNLKLSGTFKSQFDDNRSVFLQRKENTDFHPAKHSILIIKIQRKKTPTCKGRHLLPKLHLQGPLSIHGNRCSCSWDTEGI